MIYTKEVESFGGGGTSRGPKMGKLFAGVHD